MEDCNPLPTYFEVCFNEISSYFGWIDRQVCVYEREEEGEREMNAQK